MFRAEKQQLDNLIKDEFMNDDKLKPVKQKIQTISNLSNTMDSFIVNLIEEIDESRGQMFDILESIAV